MATAAEIAVSYDLGNDFFAHWLDAEMNYSCAVWADGDDLAGAQRRKLDLLHDLAGITAADRVLDIGCGWGANLRRLAAHRGVAHAHGITMSAAQASKVADRAVPRTSVEVVDLFDLVVTEPYDAVVSIEMFEHIATPDQARRGEHMAVFRRYFRAVHRTTRPGARFALHTIVLDRLPRRPDDVRDLAEVTREILPGSRCARIEEAVAAAGRWWEVRELHARRSDYARTLTSWREALWANRDEIRVRWGPDLFESYDRYLRTCVRCFEQGYLSVVQLGMRRVDD